MPLPNTQDRILSAIADLSAQFKSLHAAVHKIELQLAKRIPPEDLNRTHLDVQLLKKDSVAAANAQARVEVRIVALEAWMASQERRNAGSDVKGAIGGKALAIIAGAAASIITLLVKHLLG